MNLQALQTDLLNLIKSRSGYEDTTDTYLREVACSPNLKLVKKIIHWWRKLQVQNYCVLTGNLLKSYGTLDKNLYQFSKGKFSMYREEVGLEFINFINDLDPGPLVKALINLKMDRLIEETIFWPCEPFSIIQSLLNDNFNELILKPGEYEIVVSKSFGKDMFRVYQTAS